jgi:hypothetical protein
MAIIANDTQFIGIAPSIDLNGKKSALLNAQTEPVTMQDIIDTTGAGSQGPQGVQGPTGPQGVAGPVGPAGLTWQGSWTSGTSYVADDAVGFGGASYFCTLATSGTTSPNVDTAHWALLASQGAIGATGATGAQGPTGAQGAQGPTGMLPDFVQYDMGYNTLWNNGNGSVTTNTSFGEEALKSNASGGANSAFGLGCLRDNVAGSNNTAIGNGCLLSNTNGSANVALGTGTMESNTTGNNNVAIGTAALVNSITANNNTALGAASLVNSTSGADNTAVGYQSAFSITTGGGNVAFGGLALGNLQTGFSNVGIGYNTTVTSSTTTNAVLIGRSAIGGTNSTVIGSSASSGAFTAGVILGVGATATANNQFVVGSTSQAAGAVDTAVVTPTKRWKVKINGVDYYIALQTA